jgi:tetratricopeptide (TPR) repeat protein
MKSSVLVVWMVLNLSIVSVSAYPSLLSGKVNQGAAVVNRIEGIVWDPNKQPVADVYVELQNEMYMSLARLRTTSTGRFSFTVSNPGNYYIKVLASGTNFLDATEPVEIVNLSTRSSDYQNVDIYLKYDKRRINTGGNEIAEAVFVQEIPASARKLYEAGSKDIISGRDVGFSEIDQALQIYPSYFDALNFAGRQYVQRKEYQKSLPYLIKAIDVNQRSFSSFYALAYACYELNQRPEATEAARASTILAPASLNAHLLYGTLLRLNSDFPKAEQALLKAKKLDKDKASPDVHWQLGLLYNRMGRNKEAADELEIYLHAAPDVKNKNEIRDLIAKLRSSSE